ncbi:hypothetical protein D4R52_02045 [bacterium]|nr:MAG: hypothetical protein D4R52_02045 [bacterium]
MRSGTALTKKDVVVVLCCAVFLLVNIGSVGRAGRERAMREICLANLRQLTLAWTQYADDNSDKLCNASAGFTRQKGWTGYMGVPLAGDEIPWCGWVDPRNCATTPPDEWTHKQIAAIDYTKQRSRDGTWTGDDTPGHNPNPTLLNNWVLWKYVGNLKIYKCPAGRQEEYRNYGIVDAMNGASAYWDGQGNQPLAPCYKLRSQIENGGERFVFMDEGVCWPDSFTVRWSTVDAAQWWDLPSNRHSNGTTVSFADGHAEYRKWVDNRTIALGDDKDNGRNPSPGNLNGVGNKDFEWLEIGACGGWKTEN